MTALSGPAEAALSWVEGHLGQFGVRAHARDEHELVLLLKPLSELALTASLLGRDPALRERCHRLVTWAWDEAERGDCLLRVTAARPELVESVGLYASAYECGHHDERLHAWFAHLAGTALAGGLEIPAWRESALRHNLARLGLAEPPRASARGSWLGALPEPWTISDGTGYPMTHEVFYLTDFGAGAAARPPPPRAAQAHWGPPGGGGGGGGGPHPHAPPARGGGCGGGARPAPCPIPPATGTPFTQVVFNHTEWGARPAALPPDTVAYLAQWLPAWWRCVRGSGNHDLAAELVMTAACAGLAPMERALTELLAHARPDGGFAGPAGAGGDLPRPDGDDLRRRFLRDYHTTLVTLLALTTGLWATRGAPVPELIGGERT
ncbi:DUF6895 family protein [Nonomuraea wenchangensis]|uniref:DUF6895 family protein n=1 Tax=Nonomuraea wenchangensis TaxID=568860 RepID=UPI00384BB03A